jgi:hypothetical protein
MIFLLLLVCQYAISAESGDPALLARIHKINEKLTVISNRLQSGGDEIMSGMMAQKIEAITAEAESEQAQAIAIARWLSKNFRNTSDLLEYGAGNASPFGAFAIRMGACGTRSQTLAMMCGYLGMAAKVLNIYNEGHSTTQVQYGGEWHFFDTHRGVYFLKDGQVLDFFELQADPSLVKYLVTMPLDNSRWGSKEKRTPKTIGGSAQSYTAEMFAESVGQSKYYQEPGNCRLKSIIEVDKLPAAGLKLGDPEKTSDKMYYHWLGNLLRKNKICYYLSRPGYYSEYIDHRFVLTGTKPGERYTMTLTPFGRPVNIPENAFRGEGVDLRIDSGAQYSGIGPWRIKFTVVAVKPELLLLASLTGLGSYINLATFEFQKD